MSSIEGTSGNLESPRFPSGVPNAPGTPAQSSADASISVTNASQSSVSAETQAASQSVRMPPRPETGTSAIVATIQSLLETVREGKLQAKEMEIQYMENQPKIIESICDSIIQSGKLEAKKQRIAGAMSIVGGAAQMGTTALGAYKANKQTKGLKEDNKALKAKAEVFKDENGKFKNLANAKGEAVNRNPDPLEKDAIKEVQKQKQKPMTLERMEKEKVELGKNENGDPDGAQRKVLDDGITAQKEYNTNATSIAGTQSEVQQKYTAMGHAIGGIINGFSDIGQATVTEKIASERAAEKTLEGQKEMLDKSGQIAQSYGHEFSEASSAITGQLTSALKNLQDGRGSIRV